MSYSTRTFILSACAWPRPSWRFVVGRIALRLEERDLIAVHPEYKGYRERVLMLIPRFKGTPNSGTSAGEAA